MSDATIDLGAVLTEEEDFGLPQEPHIGQHMTAEVFGQLPKFSRKYELLNGEVIMAPSGMYHDEIVINLGSALRTFAHRNKLGKVYASSVGYRLSEKDLISPDISFVNEARLDGGESPDGYGQFSPDLAVEIVSPNDRAVEIEQKINLYLSHGTTLVWVIHPRQKTATIYRIDGTSQRISENDSFDGEAVLPGFVCKLSDIL